MSTSTVTQSLINALIKKGGTYQRLGDTNALVVRKDGKDFYFTDTMTPLTPFIYGIFVTRPEYLIAIMKDAALPYTPKVAKHVYQILITSNEYLVVLSDQQAPKRASQDLTKSAHPSVQQLAKQVLQAFPGAKFVSFELAANPSRDISQERYGITNISFDLKTYQKQHLHKGRSSAPVVDVLTELILR